jgi:hypothetical protein
LRGENRQTGDILGSRPSAFGQSLPSAGQRPDPVGLAPE